MNNPQTSTVIRVPELGPNLGKLVTGTGRSSLSGELDACRYRLTTCILTAAGEARRLAAAGKTAAAVSALGSGMWLDAWESVAGQVAQKLITAATERRESVARAVGMRARRRHQYAIGEIQTRAVTARLGAAGAGLVAELSRLEAASEEVLKHPDGSREMHWQETLVRVARRLEASWIALEETAERESTRLEEETNLIAAWKKSLWPVIVTGTIGIGAAVWLGLVLGGYVTSPDWFRTLWAFVRP